MYSNDTKRKFENILRGGSIEGATDTCTTARNYLCKGFGTSTMVKRNFESNLLVKKEQETALRKYATTNQLWIDSLPKQYLTRGGESLII